MRKSISQKIEVVSAANRNLTVAEMRKRRTCALPEILASLNIPYSCPKLVSGKRAVCGKCNRKVEKIPAISPRLCLFENCLGQCRRGLQTCWKHTCTTCEKKRLNLRGRDQYTLWNHKKEHWMRDGNKSFYTFILCLRRIGIQPPKDILRLIFGVLRTPFVEWNQAHYFLLPEIEESVIRLKLPPPATFEDSVEPCPSWVFYKCKMEAIADFYNNAKYPNYVWGEFLVPFKKSDKCSKVMYKHKANFMTVDSGKPICLHCFEENRCAIPECNFIHHATNYFCYDHYNTRNHVRIACQHQYGTIRGESYCTKCGFGEKTD